MRRLLALLLAASALHAGAATFRWSSQGDYLTADPHAQNEGLNNTINERIYESLVARGKQLEILPGLATRWEARGPTVWRFHLRAGVKFHDGTAFGADDVVYSIQRAQLPTSNFKVYAGQLGKVRKVDALTVELETPGPNPILLEHLNTVRIMSRAWCEKHAVGKPQDFKSAEETFASRNANGTGPFMLVKREAEVATVLKRNAAWWGHAERRFEGNVEEIVYRPIKQDATRMAALLTGELHMVLDPPVQDVPRLRTDKAVRILEGPENRVIFLALDQGRNELKYASVKGRNPFRDLRVRQALYQAIDVQALQRQVMRGLSAPTGSMIPTAAHSDPSLEPRAWPFDPERARKLLAEAGHPNGFEFELLCPNNRYINDERLCTALVGMFAKVGLKARLNALPRAQFFQRVDQLDFSIHLYGWGGGATDPGVTLTPVLHSFDGKGKGDFNSGRFADPELDRLEAAAATELDPARRRAVMLQAFQRVREQAYLIPLHRQVIPWAVRSNVRVLHRPDNVADPLWIRID